MTDIRNNHKILSEETLLKSNGPSNFRMLNPKLRLLGDHDQIFENGPYPKPFEFNEGIVI